MYSDVDCDAKAGYLGVCLPCWEWSNDRVLKGAQPRTGNLMRWVWQEATRLHAALCQLYGHALWITFQVSSEWTTFWLVMQNVPSGLVWSTIVVSSFSFIFPTSIIHLLQPPPSTLHPLHPPPPPLPLSTFHPSLCTPSTPPSHPLPSTASTHCTSFTLHTLHPPPSTLYFARPSPVYLPHPCPLHPSTLSISTPTHIYPDV